MCNVLRQSLRARIRERAQERTRGNTTPSHPSRIVSLQDSLLQVAGENVEILQCVHKILQNHDEKEKLKRALDLAIGKAVSLPKLVDENDNDEDEEAPPPQTNC